MIPFIKLAFGWLLKGPFGRIMDSIDHKIDNKTERERIKADVLAEYLKGQARVMTGPGWWFPLFFVVPLGLYWLAVVVYSVLWCQGCAFPQEWTIAALPKPLDEWAGWIIATYFSGRVGLSMVGGMFKR